MTTLSENLRSWWQGLLGLIKKARNEVIEECAKVADNYSKMPGDEASDIAVAIRRLKNEDK